MEMSGQIHISDVGTSCYHCIGGWVGLRIGPDAVVKRKISSPRQKSNPSTPIKEMKIDILMRCRVKD